MWHSGKSLVILGMESSEIVAQAGLKPQSSQSQPQVDYNCSILGVCVVVGVLFIVLFSLPSASK
jgi:hypothetical protein